MRKASLKIMTSTEFQGSNSETINIKWSPSIGDSGDFGWTNIAQVNYYIFMHEGGTRMNKRRPRSGSCWE